VQWGFWVKFGWFWFKKGGFWLKMGLIHGGIKAPKRGVLVDGWLKIGEFWAKWGYYVGYYGPKWGVLVSGRIAFQATMGILVGQTRGILGLNSILG
jgi:hypothetical protein